MWTFAAAFVISQAGFLISQAERIGQLPWERRPTLWIGGPDHPYQTGGRAPRGQNPFMGSGGPIAAAIWVPENLDWEFFAYQIPTSPLLPDAPLLVGFHRYNVSHADLFDHSDFDDEAEARGWFVVAPLGRWGAAAWQEQNNHGSRPSQVATQAVVEWMKVQFAIDPTRIYGVGFSMGAGWVMSHGARYPGTYAALFAAVGPTSLAYTHATNPAAASDLENILGAPPADDPFAYARISTIDLDCAGAPRPAPHMGRNLESTPLWLWNHIDDPETTLIHQIDELFLYLNDPAIAAPVLRTVSSDVLPMQVDPHSWEALTASLTDAVVCDWLEVESLAWPPVQHRYLADRSGTFGLATLIQHNAAFTDFEWSYSPAAGPLDQRIDVTCDANIARFGVSAAGAGMNFGAPLEVCLDLDPNGSDVWILDTPRPSALARGNPPQSQLIFWANDTLVLMEWQGESVRWFATLP